MKCGSIRRPGKGRADKLTPLCLSHIGRGPGCACGAHACPTQKGLALSSVEEPTCCRLQVAQACPERSRRALLPVQTLSTLTLPSSGGRSFSSDINEALSMRLQPLRKCLWGCHTSSSRSAANLEAALGFRSKYHWKAASYSSAAASWNSTSLLAIRQFGRNPVTDLFPRNRLYSAGVQIGDAASDLLVPCGLSAWVRGTVEAVHQRTSQVRAFLLGKGESPPEEILSLLSHGVIILLGRCPQRVR